MSKNLNLKDGHFSPNSQLGMCRECEGKGIKSVDMHFLEDIEFVCENCKGNKLEPFYGTISDGFFTFNEVVSLPMNEIMENIPLTPKMKRLWEYIQLLNLDYLSLNRSLKSLSGGEKQRFKLLSFLQKDIKDSFDLLYIEAES